jgi:hypothetical protein
MKPTNLLALAVLCISAVAPAAAQENIRLHFEFYNKAKQLGSPAVAVKNSEAGSVAFSNMGTRKCHSPRCGSTHKRAESRLRS